MRERSLLIGGIATLCVSLSALHGQSQPDVPAPAHGYYLFLAQAPSGCEDCYIPLLVTQTRLEDLAAGKGDGQAVVVTTYERDSLVGPPRGVVVPATALLPHERRIALLDRRYRYQEVAASEVLALLERPGGVIPISRVPSMRIPAADELKDLIERFRAAKKAEVP
jgi:hypothetical protein